MEFLFRYFKNIKDVSATFAVAGAALVALGNFFELGWVLNLGIALLGAAGIALGAHSIAGSELQIFQRGIPLSARISELFARLWGIVFAVGGLLVLGYGVLALLNPRAPIPPNVRQFFATPQGGGVLLLVGSSVGILFALSLIFVPDTRGGNVVSRFIGALMQRLVGIVWLVLCSALLALGILQVVNPMPWEDVLRVLLTFL